MVSCRKILVVPVRKIPFLLSPELLLSLIVNVLGPPSLELRLPLVDERHLQSTRASCKLDINQLE